MAGTDTSKTPLAGGPAIVLVEPQLGENIGTAARAMANFGLVDLRLVNPRDGWPSEAARKAASGADWIVDGARVFATLAEAISDVGLAYATTARPRGMTKPVDGPPAAVEALAGRLAAGEGAAVLFGRERWGLTNDEVALADRILTYPANPAFASLNIAQAVLLFGYEWFRQTASDDSGFARDTGAAAAPALADKADLYRLFEHLETELDAGGFLKPPEKRPHMVNTLRNMLHRAALTEQDVRTLRGVIVALTRLRTPAGPADTDRAGK
jgi:tRNA/rRNA methyltransferase